MIVSREVLETHIQGPKRAQQTHQDDPRTDAFSFRRGLFFQEQLQLQLVASHDF
jgi:hypothetical protein